MPDTNTLETPAPESDPISADVIWGVRGIAAEIDQTKDTTHRWLKAKIIPAKQIGGRWIASRRALRRRLFEEEAPAAPEPAQPRRRRVPA